MSGIDAAFIGGTFSSIFAAIRLIQFSIHLKGVPESAKTFVRLVEQVDEDVQHALRCRIDGGEIFEMYPDFYQKWTSNAINSTLRALDELGQLILKDTPTKLDERLEYLLKNYDKLVDQERSLRYSHATLLAAINAMHLMIFQSASPLTRPSLSPKNSGGPLRRASGQRPTSSQTSLSRQISNISTTISESGGGDTVSVLSDDACTSSQSTGSMYLQTAKANLQRLQDIRMCEVPELDSTPVTK